MIAATYTRAAQRWPWLLKAVEGWLEALPDGASVSTRLLRTGDWSRLPSDDEAAAVIAALQELGILLPGKPTRFSRQALVETAGYRRGVRDALTVTTAGEPQMDLCATVPAGLPPTAYAALARETLDLRAALFDLVASAQRRVVLASPFWDRTTAEELRELLLRRVVAGVGIDLLGRAEGGEGDEYRALVAGLLDRPGVRAYGWYERGAGKGVGVQTFHFKAVVIDDGVRAYLGSANLTVAGLRSRLELGVVLRGSTAVSLARILDLTLGIATPLQH